MPYTRFLLIALASAGAIRAQALNYESIAPELRLGYTDNVLQDDLNKKADAYTYIGAGLRWAEGADSLRLQLGLQTHQSEKSADYFQYALRYKTNWSLVDSPLRLSLSGLNYTKEQLASTDESYNNVSVGAYISKTLFTRNSFYLYFEPGTKAVFYSDLNGRKDLAVFARLLSDWEINSRHTLSPLIELGVVPSTQSYYSRQYIEIGASYYYQIEDTLMFYSDLYLQNSTYPNRRVSDVLQMPQRNGRVTTVPVETAETTQSTYLAVGITKTIQQFKASLDAIRSSLTSRSGLEKYTENTVQLTLQYEF